jgi:hypothetical protein
LGIKENVTFTTNNGESKMPRIKKQIIIDVEIEYSESDWLRQAIGIDEDEELTDVDVFDFFCQEMDYNISISEDSASEIKILNTEVSGYQDIE